MLFQRKILQTIKLETDATITYRSQTAYFANILV